MSDAGKKAVDKLQIIKSMAVNPETKEIAKVMIEYIHATEKSEAGFTSNGGKDVS